MRAVSCVHTPTIDLAETDDTLAHVLRRPMGGSICLSLPTLNRRSARSKQLLRCVHVPMVVVSVQCVTLCYVLCRREIWSTEFGKLLLMFPSPIKQLLVRQRSRTKTLMMMSLMPRDPARRRKTCARCRFQLQSKATLNSRTRRRTPCLRAMTMTMTSSNCHQGSWRQSRRCPGTCRKRSLRSAHGLADLSDLERQCIARILAPCTDARPLPQAI